jgi:hypothetical protein
MRARGRRNPHHAREPRGWGRRPRRPSRRRDRREKFRPTNEIIEDGPHLDLAATGALLKERLVDLERHIVVGHRLSVAAHLFSIQTLHRGYVAF